ncbi:MAG: hypothetical protein JNM56_13060 [Planctomycetia bacterium]|nr:hypothetical protein [Planctomycetia bacterium]
MIESPLIEELLEQVRIEAGRHCILRVLAARFGSVPDDLIQMLNAIRDDQKFDVLINCAALCPDLEVSRQRLQAGR